MGYSYQIDRNGNPYAHYQANAVDTTRIASLFSLQKQKNMLSTQSKKLQLMQVKNLKKTNGVTTKDALGIIKSLEEGLKDIGVGNSDLKTGSSKLVGDLSAYGLAKDIPQLLDKSNLADFNSAMNEMILQAEKIVDGPGLDSLIESYIQDNPNIIFSSENKGLPHNVQTWINKVVAQASSKKEGTLSLFKTQTGSASNDREAIRLLSLVKIINIYMTREGFQSKDNLDTVSSMMHYLAISLSRFGGSMNEVLIRESVEGLESSVLTDIKTILSGSDYATVKSSDGKSLSYSQAKRSGVVSKADVLVDYTFSKDVGGNQVKIKMKTPIGISAKKVGNPDIKNISLSSGSTLGAILSRCDNISKVEKYYLFNIIANTGVQDAESGVIFDKTGSRTDLGAYYGLAKGYLSAANILNSLVGTLTEKDMSYFFIVNNKVYRTSEIIQMVIEGKINLKTSLSPAALGNSNTYLLKTEDNVKSYNSAYKASKKNRLYAKDRQMALLRSENLYTKYISIKASTKLNYGKTSSAERLGF